MPPRIDAFVDGGYVRNVAEHASVGFVNPYAMCNLIAQRSQTWLIDNIRLRRVIYYDAKPEDDSRIDPHIEEYWSEIEHLPFTELGFGTTREGVGRKAPRQKGVDTLLAADLLAGAFDRLFTFAILVSGDADFVPVVNEARRRGAIVVLAGVSGSVADDLKRASDLYIELEPKQGVVGLFPPM